MSPDFFLIAELGRFRVSPFQYSARDVVDELSDVV
jgi:hypothetical protein